MASSPVERISGASTPTLLAMSSFSTNRLHDELTGLKRWRQMYDAAMNEKNEELQKLQLINQRQAQALNDSIVQLEQQTMTINSMKQNETILEKKVVKLEEVHQILKKNLSKLEKTVSQCEFVRLDLERMYEHQERMVKNLSNRVDSTIETKIEHLQSQLKMMEELHDRVRQELSKEKAERAEENHQTFELRTMMNKIEGEYRQLQFIHNNAQMKINELTEELNKSQHFIETLIVDHDKELKTKVEEIETLNKRIDHLVFKIDTNQTDFFNLQETNRILQERLDEMKEKSMEHAQSHHSEVEACRTELENRAKENQTLKETNLQLNEKMIESEREINELKEKNQRFEREIEEMKSNWDKQINAHFQQTTEHDHRFEQLMKEFHEKERTIDDLKEKHRELMEKMELIEDDMVHLSKENEDLRTQNHLLLQETDERNEQIKQKDVIVEATNIEIGEKEKEIEELKSKLSSLEERFSKNQNLLTSLRSSMGEKDAKIKRLEQGTNVNASPSSSLLSRPNAVRRTGSVQHPLTINQNRTSTPNSSSQQSKINSREKRMLPPSTSADLTSTPKKILRLSQNKPNNEQDNAPYIDDDRDEVASNTSVASLFEYLKKI